MEPVVDVSGAPPAVSGSHLLTLSARTPVSLERSRSALVEVLTGTVTGSLGNPVGAAVGVEVGAAAAGATEATGVAGGTREAAVASVASAAQAAGTSRTALADAAYTLHVGREDFDHRIAVAGADAAALIRALEQARPASVSPGAGVVFAFPGQGSQYPRMGAGLYEHVPAFRAHYDECADVLARRHDLDLRRVAFAPEPAAQQVRSEPDEFARAYYLQPALFACEYALARTLMDWGVAPVAVVGHSLGEYVAACIAGVLDLADALSLVMARAHAMEAAGPGAMLSVKLPALEAAQLVADDPRVDVAVINSPGDVVLSGGPAAIDALAARLSERGVGCQRLHTTRAFHSPMMTGAAAAVARAAQQVTLRPPRLPIASNLTGTWLTDEQAIDPGYWGRHLRGTVRFADNAAAVLTEGPRAVLEVGPGRTLSALVTSIALAQEDDAPLTVPFMRHPLETSARDEDALLGALGRLWCAGTQIDWAAFHAGELRRRVPLPDYAFDGQRCWPSAADAPDAPALGAAQAAAQTKLPIDDWFCLPSWRRTLPPTSEPTATEPSEPTEPTATESADATDEAGNAVRWLVLHDDDGLGRDLRSALLDRGDSVTSLRRAEVRGAPDTLPALLRSLAEQGRFPNRIISLWPLSPPADDGGVPAATAEMVDLARALTRHGGTDPLHVWVITDDAVQVDAEHVHPETATLLGPCLVLSQENPHITCRVLDVRGDHLPRVLRECTTERPDAASIVAWRGGHRWVPAYEPAPVPAVTASRLRPGGVYLVTGGLGRIGLVLAEHLAALPATVVLTTRSEVPGDDPNWAALAEGAADSDTRGRYARLRDLEAAGGRVVLLQADMADAAGVERALSHTVETFGRLDGVLHAAGLAELAYLPDLSDDVVQREFAPKVAGLRHLDRAIGRLAERGRPTPEFVVLFSSIAGVLGGLAMGAYMGANRFMDAFAGAEPRRHGVDWVVVNWDDWDFDYSTEQTAAYTGAGVDRFAMTPQEGIEVLERVLALGEPAQLLISTRPLPARLTEWVDQHVTDAGITTDSPDVEGEPEVDDDGGGSLERQLAGVYERVLGVPHVDPQDNFFDLGGDSLLAAQILAQLRRTLSINGQLQLQDIFSRPSVAALADHLGRLP